MKKLVIFDADGTLFDTHQAVYELFLDMLRKFNKRDTIKQEEFHYIMKNSDWENIFTTFDFQDQEKQPCLTYTASKAAFYYNQYLDFFDGVDDLLDTLEQNGCNIAIATNSLPSLYQDYLSQKNKHYPIHGYGTHKQKPHPEQILSHMQNHNIGPKDTIMIGDSLSDLQAAQNAGVDFIRAGYGGYFQTGEIKSLGIQNIANSPNSILSFI